MTLTDEQKAEVNTMVSFYVLGLGECQEFFEDNLFFRYLQNELAKLKLKTPFKLECALDTGNNEPHYLTVGNKGYLLKTSLGTEALVLSVLALNNIKCSAIEPLNSTTLLTQ